MEPILECRDVSLYYPGQNRFILKNVNLSVDPGEIVALLGESGCGKSSLLNILGGLLTATQGFVTFKGQRISSSPIGLSMVFQEHCLLPWLNVAKNVGFGLGFKSLGIPKAERKSRIEEALKEVGLTQASQKFPQTLSGGMAQRAALARTLARKSEFTLLDEPFSSLDAITRRSMQELLLSLIRSHHSSAVLVTHDLDEALALSDRLLLMHRSPDQTLLTSWNLTDLLGSTSTSQPTLRSRSDLFEELRAEISLKLSTENLGFSD